IASNMKARLLELEQIKTHERDPGLYARVIIDELGYIASFEYAPIESRLRHLIAKQKQIPRFLDGARSHLSSSAPLFQRPGLASLRVALALVRNDLPKVFASVKDSKLQSDFKKSTEQAAEAITKYIGSLERAKLDPAVSHSIGGENLQAKLKHEEGIDVSLDTLVSIAARDLARTQEAFKKTAAQIDPARTPTQVWAKVRSERPQAGRVADEAESQLVALLRFLEDKQVVATTGFVRPVVAPAMEFERRPEPVLWSPGAFETRALPARLVVSDLVATDADQTALPLSYSALWMHSINKAVPGQAVQLSSLKQVGSPVRKTRSVGGRALTEGWALYAEQMVLDEGFGGGNSKLRLAQLADDLLAASRLIAGIRLHAEGMQIDEAVRFLMENAYLSNPEARQTAEQLAYDPGSIMSIVGKLVLLKLREDYQRNLKDGFSLAEFHTKLFSTGQAPLWVVRQMLLPGDKGKLIE
ncbi:MAG TPA: DUF885 family protein, partial [Blastocatellia bacterium]|nr:DUF885 family protein [Blastocatellia bacterium]